ncbi:Phosphoribosylamine--glycine ligase [hydrothermal vent metagenome]|uniref:phosphoribosylamine--glycine ligase n=1 Tax=hydrothermal vent metagenome TaxID=652676 RepID=A0A3B1DNX3_9ZZZZ
MPTKDTPINILLIGGGGREHALAAAIARSPRLDTLYITHPQNPGLASLGTPADVPVLPKELYRLEQWCDHHQIGLVVIGPEAPLAAGFADALATPTRLVFGPTKAGAMLEADKAWCKALLREAMVPTAEGRVFTNAEAALAYTSSRAQPPVIKASGLAAGKGVVLPGSTPEACEVVRSIMIDRIFGDAGKKIIVEDRLTGREVSVLAITDGRSILMLPPCQDHKRLLDGDHGPNTGGMGAFCPSEAIDPATMAIIEREILVPTVDALKREGIDYRGVLYAGLMLTPSGPKVLEYNVRFGDPECQPLMVRLQSDIVELMQAACTRSLDRLEVEWDARPAVCVVLASEGYPAKPVTGQVITGLESAEAMEGVTIFHAGTAKNSQGELVTAGGRVLSVVGQGETIAEARSRAYAACGAIDFPGKQLRTDIAGGVAASV